MRTVFYKIKNYDQWIRFEDRKIFKFNCTCPDFVFRRVQKGERCKHLMAITQMIDLSWEKQNDVKIGLIKLNDKQKQVLRELVEFTCEACGLKEEQCGKLQPHRLTRGNIGGTYIPSNIRMFCSRCHKNMHAGEFT